MSYIIKSRIEVVESCSDGRLIYIKRDEDKIVGLNFCQGTSALDIIWMPDRELTIFYESNKEFFGGDSELDRVNQAIGAYIEYRKLCGASKQRDLGL